MRSYISFAQINMYCRCGLQYMYRYIENIKVPPRAAMILGSAFHLAEEENFKQKVQSHIDLPISDVLDLYSDKIDQGFEEEVLLSEDEKSKGKKGVKAEVKDKGVEMLKLYHKHVAPEIQPLFVEHEFELDLDELYLPVKGRIDLIDDAMVIIDHKTVKRASQSDADNSIQLSVYALAFRELFGFPPAGLRLDCVTQSTTPKIHRFLTGRTEDQLKRLVRRIQLAVQGIMKGVFIPPDQGSWACNYCGYRDLGICEYYL